MTINCRDATDLDLLAQLRQGHFWLVLASTGLLIAASLPKSSVYNRALEEETQLEAVNAILTKDKVAKAFTDLQLPPSATLAASSIVRGAFTVLRVLSPTELPQTSFEMAETGALIRLGSASSATYRLWFGPPLPGIHFTPTEVA